jgi:hypothetical protein
MKMIIFVLMLLFSFSFLYSDELQSGVYLITLEENDHIMSYSFLDKFILKIDIKNDSVVVSFGFLDDNSIQGTSKNCVLTQ